MMSSWSEGKDLHQLNKLSKGEWGKMVAIVLIKSLTTPLTQLLASLHPSAMHVVRKCADSAVLLFELIFCVPLA